MELLGAREQVDFIIIIIIIIIITFSRSSLTMIIKGGGWFRLERGVNALNIESYPCHWAVPSRLSIDKALKEYYLSGK